MAYFPDQDSQPPSSYLLSIPIDRMIASIKTELAQICPEIPVNSDWPDRFDIKCSVDERIMKCSDVIAGLKEPGMPVDVYLSLRYWFENEVLEIREEVIHNCALIKRRIQDVTSSIERDLEVLKPEFGELGITVLDHRASAALPPVLKISPAVEARSVSLNSTQSSISTKQRIHEWKQSKCRQKEEYERERALRCHIESDSRKRQMHMQKERRRMVAEYRKQKREENEAESRAKVNTHLADIKYRQEQYVSLGIAERNRMRASKFIERRTVRLSPLKRVNRTRPSSPSSNKPSKLYHPTKSSLNHSTVSMPSDAPGAPTPLFTPYLSRYSMK